MKTARFTAAFKVPLSTNCEAFKIRTFKGTINVTGGVNDLAVAVIGALHGIAQEENLGEVQSLRIAASIVKARKPKF